MNLFVSRDLALRNCQVDQDKNLIIGDYGLSPQSYPNDYYPGRPPIPVRWIPPESIICTESTIQPKSQTLNTNIWSLGITFWELITFAQQPYPTLTDDDVVTLVLEKQTATLSEPTATLPYFRNLYQLCRLCVSPPNQRPEITQIQSMLVTLVQNSQIVSDSEFLSRWNSFKPNKKSPSLTNLHGSFDNLKEGSEKREGYDSWLQNIEDLSYQKGLSQAMHELDSALALEESSSSETSHQPSPGPEVLDHKVNFKLGPIEDRNDGNVQDVQDDSLLDSILIPKSHSGKLKPARSFQTIIFADSCFRFRNRR